MTLPSQGEMLGRFRLRRLLGVGGTGAVYEALDSRDGGRLALKVLHRVGSAQLAAFKTEFRIASRLAHPNLVPPYELATDGTRWFLTMELVDGQELLSYVCPRPSAPCDETRLRAILLQVLDGLGAMHASGVVHRDLKPANVLVAGDGTARIADFGLALLRRGGHAWFDHEGKVVGSPAYMAPEQAAGQNTIGTAADLYGVGAILFEALTGRLPFEGNIYGMVMQKISCEAPDPRLFNPRAPADLACLAQSLLAREPSLRPTLAQTRRHLERAAVAPRVERVPDEVPLVGRDAELHAVDQALASARRGRCSVLLVRGHSGVGKTALLRAAAVRIRSLDDGVVLWGACHELESIPYKGIDALMDELRGYLLSLSQDERSALLTEDFWAVRAMFSTLADVSAAEREPLAPAREKTERPRAIGALAGLLRRMGRTRTVAILLDDMQWADADGVQLLMQLLGQAAPISALFVLACRNEEPAGDALAAQLAALRGLDFAQVILHPLSRQAARALARSLLADINLEQADRIARIAGGEPFLVEQLARHAGGSDSDVLLDTIAQRAAQLGSSARALLDVVAVAAQPIPERLAAACLNLPDARFLVGGLIALSLLRRVGTAQRAMIYPYHDRIRDALASALSQQARARLHLTLAQTAEREQLLPPSALAEHFERGGWPGRAAGHALEAALSAERSLAFDLAAATFARASLLATPGSPLEQRARAGRARALHRAGRCSEAGAAYLDAAASSTGADRDRLQSQAVEAWLSCGRVDRALQVLHPLLNRIGSPYPASIAQVAVGLASHTLRASLLRRRPALRADAGPREQLRSDLLWSAGKGLLPISPPQGAVLAFRSVWSSFAAGDAHRVGRSLAFLGSGFVPLLIHHEKRYLRWARELAQADPHLALMVGVAETSQALLMGAWSQAIESAARVLRDAPHCQAASAWEESSAHTLLVAAYEYQGELRQMERASLACLGAVQERGDQITEVTIVSAHGYCCAARHDARALDDRIAEMTRAMQGWSVSFGMWDFYQLRLRVLRHLAWGKLDEAWTLLEETWPKLQRHHLLRMPIVRGPALVLRLSVLLERLHAPAVPRQGDAPSPPRRQGGRGPTPARGPLRSRSSLIQSLRWIREPLLRETPEHAAEVRRLVSWLARESRPDAQVHARVARAALAHRAGKLTSRDRELAGAEHMAREADLRLVSRMIARLRAALRGDSRAQARFERELHALGVEDPVAWARFITPGFSPCPT